MQPKQGLSNGVPPVIDLTGDSPDAKRPGISTVSGRGPKRKSSRCINLTGDSPDAKRPGISTVSGRGPKRKSSRCINLADDSPDAKRPRISTVSDNTQIAITGVSQATDMIPYGEAVAVFKQAWPDHVHIPSSRNGGCCYTTMENMVNFTQLIHNKTYQHITGQMIAQKIKMAVEALRMNINLDDISQTDSELQKEIQDLFHLSTMEEAIQMLEDMNNRLESYLKLDESANNIEPAVWGNTDMFLLMSICYGINIERYHIGAKAKSKSAGHAINVKPVAVEFMTSNINDYKHISSILEDYLQNYTSNVLHPTFTLACYHRHFDMWLAPEQAQIIRTKMDALPGKVRSDPWQMKILQELRLECSHPISKRRVLFSRTF